ncbi:hypothetical protein EON63_23415 [archaeon]|nr:MAG: hypothetical protein EON63_23415 [archaeon]
MNALELAMLEALKYIIRVPASEYAKYYFHLRSMMVSRLCMVFGVWLLLYDVMFTVYMHVVRGVCTFIKPF